MFLFFFKNMLYPIRLAKVSIHRICIYSSKNYNNLRDKLTIVLDSVKPNREYNFTHPSGDGRTFIDIEQKFERINQLVFKNGRILPFIIEIKSLYI